MLKYTTQNPRKPYEDIVIEWQTVTMLRNL